MTEMDPGIVTIFTHSVATGGLWVFWKIAGRVISAWKEISKDRVAAVAAEKSEERAERIGLHGQLGQMAEAIQGNTASNKDLSTHVRELVGVTREQGVRIERALAVDTARKGPIIGG